MASILKATPGRHHVPEPRLQAAAQRLDALVRELQSVEGALASSRVAEAPATDVAAQLASSRAHHAAVLEAIESEQDAADAATAAAAYAEARAERAEAEALASATALDAVRAELVDLERRLQYDGLERRLQYDGLPPHGAAARAAAHPAEPWELNYDLPSHNGTFESASEGKFDQFEHEAELERLRVALEEACESRAAEAKRAHRLEKEAKTAKAGSAAALASAEKQIQSSRASERSLRAQLLERDALQQQLEEQLEAASIAALEHTAHGRETPSEQMPSVADRLAEVDRQVICTPFPPMSPPILPIFQDLIRRFDRQESKLAAEKLAMARREAKLVETQQMVAEELSDMQRLVRVKQLGPALLRLTAEKKQALAQLAPLRHSNAQLSTEINFTEGEMARLRAHNAQLCERLRQQQQQLQVGPEMD